MISETYFSSFIIRGLWVETGEQFEINYPHYITLPRDRELIVAIDPSTNQTGLAVSDTDKNPILLADIITKNIYDKEAIHQMLEHFFEDSLAHANVHSFILEEPFLGNNEHTYRVLNRLKRHLKSLTKRIPALTNSRFGEIKPSAWRSTFLADKKYKGRKHRRSDAKESAMEETLCQIPTAAPYFNSFAPSIPDSCDAYGILMGYLEKVNGKTNNDLTIVNSTMKKNFRIKKTYFVVGVTSDNLMETVKEHVPIDILTKRGTNMLEYDTNSTIEDNVSRACSEYDEVQVLYMPESEQDIVFMWEYGFKVDRSAGEFYAVICYRDKPAQPKSPPPPPPPKERGWKTHDYFRKDGW